MKKKETSKFKKGQALKRRQRFLRSVKRLALIIFIISFIWISVDGYHRLVSRQIIDQSAYLIKPLNPVVKVEVLEKIKNKKFFVVSEIEENFVRMLASQESSPSGENEEKEESNQKEAN